MANYATESIRTVALVGHGAAGKTTLAEALLVKAGALPAGGSVERGTTVSDFDPLEKTVPAFAALVAAALRDQRHARPPDRHARDSRISSASRSARSTPWRPRRSSSTRSPASR